MMSNLRGAQSNSLDRNRKSNKYSIKAKNGPFIPNGRAVLGQKDLRVRRLPVDKGAAGHPFVEEKS